MALLVRRLNISDTLRGSNFNPQWGGGGRRTTENMMGDVTPTMIYGSALGSRLKQDHWQRRLSSLQALRYQARIQQADNRMQMAIDEDFYDSIQMDINDIAILMDRKQPILTFNVIKDTVNWMLGTERRTRIDYAIRPRNSGDEKEAKVKEHIFKYDDDINHADYVSSQVFSSQVKAGLGWMEVGARNDGDSPIYIRDEKWRNIWFDHLSTGVIRKPRFVIREKWVDLDVAKVLFPESSDDLEVMAQHVNSIYPYNPDDVLLSDPASEFDVESQLDSIFSPRGQILRERVRLTEMWYRVPAKVKVLRLVDESIPWGILEGTIYRESSPDQKYLVKNGYFDTYDVMRMVVRRAFWCGSVYLKDDLSPYYHWEFPLIPFWCYIRERDNMPYGVIRDLRDPQIDYNKRRSKALFLMSAAQIVAEKGAVDDKEEAIYEAQRADGFVEYNAGKKLEIQRNLDIGTVHLNMAHDDERMIRSLVGHIEPQVAETKKEVSGKALDKLEQGTQITSGVIFDNYWFGRQLAGEIRLALIEQFRTVEEEVIINPGTKRQRFDWINKPNQDGTIENPITKAKARFIIGKRDYRESIRMSMFQTLSEIVMFLAKTAPEAALSILDLLVDFMDELGPLKSELVARIRAINGQFPPEDEMTEDELKAKKQSEEQKAQKKSIMEKLNMGLAKAKVDEAEGKALSQQMGAMKKITEATMRQIEQFLTALEGAGALSQNPGLSEAADTLIQEARRSLSPISNNNNESGRQLSGG